MENGERKSKVALYARVSTARDQDPRMQIEELRRLAEQRGWNVIGEFVDHGVSGTKERRPELDRLMADVSKGKINLVRACRFL